jgi:hypothetical protein
MQLGGGNIEIEQHGTPPLALNLPWCFVISCQEHGAHPLALMPLLFIVIQCQVNRRKIRGDRNRVFD